MGHFLFGFSVAFGAAALVGAVVGVRRAIRASMVDE